MVLLTGDYAYKIKKPMKLGFLDFSTLEKRHECCEQEVRLNRRYAPDLYLGVVPIRFHGQQYIMGGDKGEIAEYAIRMRQFDPSQQLDCLLKNNELAIDEIEQLAVDIGQFHKRAEPRRVRGKMFSEDQLAEVIEPMGDNIEMIRHQLKVYGEPESLELDFIEQWTFERWKTAKEKILYRKRNGYFRECHGDLHLANIARIDGKLTPFDGIEFNDKLRWIDIASEVAFLVMDLEVHQYPDYAWRFLNRYLAETGDYEMLEIIDFYKVYRALVRAKVAAIGLNPETDGDQAEQLEIFQAYLKQAKAYIKKQQQPALLMTHGYSGSGKTWGSKRIADTLGMIHLRSDVERKRLAGLGASTEVPEEQQHALYNPEMTEKTYDRLRELAKILINARYHVIVDATFLREEIREPFIRLATEQQTSLLMLNFMASTMQMFKNIKERQQRGDDASDATEEVLMQQITDYDAMPLDYPYVIVEYGQPLPFDKISEWMDYH